jgi:hypothetical protein
LKNTALIAVAQGNTEPWITIRNEGQEKTWVATKVDGIGTIYFRSKHTPFFVRAIDIFHEKNRYKNVIGLWQGRFDKVISKLISKSTPRYRFDDSLETLIVDSWSTYQLQGKRYIALYDWFLKETDYSFLFTTTTSSYINKQNLLDLVQKFHFQDLIYAGYLLPENKAKKFVSGAGTLLSRRCVEVLVENWSRFKFDTLEDVSHGDLMRDLGVIPIPLARVNLLNMESVMALPISILESEFHYRCKSSEVPRQDVQIMNILHKRIVSL